MTKIPFFDILNPVKKWGVFVEDKIRVIDEEFNEIDRQLELCKYMPPTMEKINKMSELSKRKRHLELCKFDLIHGTHKVEIKELETKLNYFCISLGKAKDRYAKSKIYGFKYNKKELDDIQAAVDMLQLYIISLEDKDKKIIQETERGLL